MCLYEITQMKVNGDFTILQSLETVNTIMTEC